MGRPYVLNITQSGSQRFDQFALLLFTLPSAFTYQVLFALPRLAERKRTFCVQPMSYSKPLLF